MLLGLNNFKQVIQFLCTRTCRTKTAISQFCILVISFARIAKLEICFSAAVNAHHCPYTVLMFRLWQYDDWFKFYDANRLRIMVIIGCFVGVLAFLFAYWF